MNRRTEIVRLVMTPEEKANLKSQSHDMGLGMSAFIREAVYWTLQEKRTAERLEDRQANKEN